MVGKTRLAGLVVAMLTVMLLAGCGSSKDKTKTNPAVAPPKLSGDKTIKVDEAKSSFDPSSLTVKAGTIKITVMNPTSAKSQHGIGIDGGLYKNVVGAAVKPGRSTSLTVAVKAGKYTLFDSYKKNRKAGYKTALTVTK